MLSFIKSQRVVVHITCAYWPFGTPWI